MSREALVYAVSGTFFGLLMGWILGSQTGRARVPSPAPQAAAAPAQAGPDAPAPKPVDMQRVAMLEKQANAETTNAAVRAELGNLYFDADRFDLAIPWYQAALRITPRDVNVSTDLATALYATNRVDDALAQVDHSLSIDPDHLKTLLNRGLFLAFGKQDLDGASRSFERVMTLAPDSEEGLRAKTGLEGIRAAHSGAPGVAGSAPTGAGGS
jgi:tetratricopeptide (TPR) repeat protein